MKFIKLVTFSVILAAIAGSLYLYLFAINPFETPPVGGIPAESTKKIEFDLLRGMRPMEIATALEKAGIIKSREAMYWLGKFNGGWINIKAADYELSPFLSPEQIFKLFKSGIGIQHSILVREGDNIYQVSKSFEDAGLGRRDAILKLLRSKELMTELGLEHEGMRTFEGYLYPNTYFYDKHDPNVNVVKRMVEAFLRSWSPEYEARAKELGLTRYEVMTLASMIEKETGAAFERPMISSVFHNRLRKKMRLQSDPTTIYGMWEHYDGNIHKSDLLRHTDYNTYTVPALPAGPISNPHPDSVKAALYPADTDLFFVSKNDGTHVFSKTYDEHVNWVKKTQLDPKAREGKSWRNLKQNPAVKATSHP
jgi:UPF0755 protein